MTIRYSRRSFFVHARTALASIGFSSVMTPMQSMGAAISPKDEASITTRSLVCKRSLTLREPIRF